MVERFYLFSLSEIAGPITGERVGGRGRGEVSNLFSLGILLKKTMENTWMTREKLTQFTHYLCPIH